MNNELKKEIRDYYLNNMRELITLVNNMYVITENETLEDLIVYPMEEINNLLNNDYSLLDVLVSIDYENFNPFNPWYKWDYNGSLISLDNKKLENEYENCILEILDILFTYIDNNGIENAINDFHLSEDSIKIFKNFNENMENKKAFCIQYEINQLALDNNFSKKSMEIIKYYNNTFKSDILNKYEEYQQLKEY